MVTGKEWGLRRRTPGRRKTRTRLMRRLRKRGTKKKRKCSVK